MLKAFHHRNPRVVDLKDNILVNTTIPPEQHAALRSGFMGLPLNPRWDVQKYHSWKTGRQLRDDLEKGKLMVRSSDFLLMPKAEAENRPIPQSPTGVNHSILTWTKNILTAIPIA